MTMRYAHLAPDSGRAWTGALSLQRKPDANTVVGSGRGVEAGGGDQIRTGFHAQTKQLAERALAGNPLIRIDRGPLCHARQSHPISPPMQCRATLAQPRGRSSWTARGDPAPRVSRKPDANGCAFTGGGRSHRRWSSTIPWWGWSSRWTPGHPPRLHPHPS